MIRICIMKMKIWTIGLLLSGALGMAACGEGGSGKIKIAASFAPVYDFAKRIAGDKAEVLNVVGDAEPHEFQLNESRKMAFIESADLFLMFGHGIDPWAVNLNAKAQFEVAQNVTFKTNLISRDEGVEDPHAWLSFQRDKIMLKNIADKICEIDPANAEYYKSNLSTALTSFEAVEASYSAFLKDGNLESPYIVTSHEAFGYLASEFGLTQVGIGDLADHEPSSSRLKEIVDFIQNNGVRYLFLEELDSPGFVQTVVSELAKRDYSVEYRELSCYECVSDKDYEKGEDFLSLMNKNLEVLKECLK